MLLLPLLLSLFACNQDASPLPERAPTNIGRVAMIAADGATWNVIRPLIERGEMPHVQALIEQGCAGDLTSQRPSLSPRIWTSVATGVPVEAHEIRGFVFQSGRKKRLYNSEMVKFPRLWEMASAQGISAGVTNYWFTYPAKEIDGFIISDHVLPWRSERINNKFAGGQSPPVAQKRLVHPIALGAQIEGMVANTPGGRRNLTPKTPEMAVEVRDAILIEDRLVMEMADAGVAAQGPVSLDIRYLKGLDAMSHFFWRFHSPDERVFRGDRPTEEEVELFGDYVGDAYRQFDALVGDYVATMGDNDVLLIASDHGFEGRHSEERSHVTGKHGARNSTDGLFIVAGGPITNAHCPSRLSLYDVAPTILQMLGMPVPTYMTGTVGLSLFPHSWTAAYPVRYTRASYPHEVVESISEEPKRGKKGKGKKGKGKGKGKKAKTDVPQEDERIDWLKTLGYMDGDE